MKCLLVLVLFCVMALESSAQKYVAEKGVITFFSDAVIEDITATNSKSSSIINIQTGDIAFSVPIREFQFDKKLMQQHFNEKYMESDKFPKAYFSGKLYSMDFSQKNIQKVKAKGKLTIHGVAHEVEIDGTACMNDSLTVKSDFIVKLADYKIDIPRLMFQNIAEQVKVKIEFMYKPR